MFQRIAEVEFDGDVSVNRTGSMFMGLRDGSYAAVTNSDDCDWEGQDPRFQPWYAATASGPKTIVLVIDVSASMGESNLDVLTRAAAAAIAGTLTSADALHIVTFDSRVRAVFTGLGLSVRMTNVNFARVGSWIDTHVRSARGAVGSSAALFAPLQRAVDILAATAGAVGCQPTILFFTDGTGSISESERSAVVRSARTIGAVVFSYAMGHGAPEALLRALACATDGIFHKVATIGDLTAALPSYLTYYATAQNGGAFRWVLAEDTTHAAGLPAACTLLYSPPLHNRSTGALHTMLGVACVGLSVLADLDVIQSRTDYGGFVAAITARSARCTPMWGDMSDDQVLRAVQTLRTQPGASGELTCCRDCDDLAVIPHLQVTTGKSYCQVAGNCVTGGRGDHGPREACAVTVNTAGRLTASEFHTEAASDVVTIGDSYYSGATGPRNLAVAVNQSIVWRSSSSKTNTISGSQNRTSWTLCITPGGESDVSAVPIASAASMCGTSLGDTEDQPSGLTVMSGSAYCTIDANGCATDGAGNYGHQEACTIKASSNGALTATHFHTEPGYDEVTIGAVSYSGRAGPQNVPVAAGQTFTWRSDGSAVDINSGWTICFSRGLTAVFAPGRLTVMSGSAYCSIDANGCATDGLGNHGHDEACAIQVQSAGALTAIHFDTEARYDLVTIGTVPYSGRAGPQNVPVAAGTTFTWRSDGSVNNSGWTICFGFSTASVSSDSLCRSISSGKRYEPMDDIAGQGSSLEGSMEACVDRCVAVESCAHWSYQRSGRSCHLSSASASLRVAESGVTSGSLCTEAASVSHAPPTTSPPESSRLRVTSGSIYCTITANGICATDGLGNHGHDEACVIQVPSAGALTATHFDTEARYDLVTIGLVSYSGRAGPQNVPVAAGTTFTWRSDGSVSNSGWTICFSRATSSPQSAAPTPAPSVALSLLRSFVVMEGAVYCEAAGNCIADGAGNYSNNAACSIQINRAGRLSATAFSTEMGYDIVTIGSQSYSGTGGGPRDLVVAAGTMMTWTTDRSVTGAGWTICFVPEPAAVRPATTGPAGSTGESGSPLSPDVGSVIAGCKAPSGASMFLRLGDCTSVIWASTPLSLGAGLLTITFGSNEAGGPSQRDRTTVSIDGNVTLTLVNTGCYPARCTATMPWPPGAHNLMINSSSAGSITSDHMYIASVVHTASPRWPAQSPDRDFVLQQSGSCSIPVTTFQGCSWAAAALRDAGMLSANFPIVAGRDGAVSTSTDPPFCYREGESLKFDAEGENTGGCTASDQCLCRGNGLQDVATDSGADASNGCSESRPNSKYVPIDNIAGHNQTVVGSNQACAERCASTALCAHWSRWATDGSCSLSSAVSSRVTANGVSSGSCTNRSRCFSSDWKVRDAAGNKCAWYDGREGSCGSFDDVDFDASLLCCGCSGGRRGSDVVDGGYSTEGSGLDQGGDACSWYVGRYASCGYFDDADFTANASCCACGGGAPLQPLNALAFPGASSLVYTCSDTAGSATDSAGDACAWYVGYARLCSAFDDLDFTARSMCCICGGGHTSIEPYDINASVFWWLSTMSAMLGLACLGYTSYRTDEDPREDMPRPVMLGLWVAFWLVRFFDLASDLAVCILVWWADPEDTAAEWYHERGGAVAGNHAPGADTPSWFSICRAVASTFFGATVLVALVVAIAYCGCNLRNLPWRWMPPGASFERPYCMWLLYFLILEDVPQLCTADVFISNIDPTRVPTILRFSRGVGIVSVTSIVISLAWQLLWLSGKPRREDREAAYATGRLNPLRVAELNGDRHEFAGWGGSKDLTAAFAAEHPELAALGEFHLAAADGSPAGTVYGYGKRGHTALLEAAGLFPGNHDTGAQLVLTYVALSGNPEARRPLTQPSITTAFDNPEYVEPAGAGDAVFKDVPVTSGPARAQIIEPPTTAATYVDTYASTTAGGGARAGWPEPSATEPGTDADVLTMTVPELKMAITAAGLSFTDCLEKPELQARAIEARATAASRHGFANAAADVHSAAGVRAGPQEVDPGSDQAPGAPTVVELDQGAALDGNSNV